MSSACQDAYLGYVKTAFKKYPADIKQFIGSDSSLRDLIPLMFGSPKEVCSEADLNRNISQVLTSGESDPFSKLPVLFDSTLYVSTNTVPLRIEQLPADAAACATYWYGVYLSSEPILRAKSCTVQGAADIVNRFEYSEGAKKWFPSAGGVWTSGLTKTIVVQNVPKRVRLHAPGQAAVTLGDKFDATDVIALEMSGDESTYFLWRKEHGWFRFNPSTDTWDGLTIPNSYQSYTFLRNYDFASSFDGSNIGFVYNLYGSNLVLEYKIGARARQMVVLESNYLRPRYIAILNSIFFVAEGRKLFAMRVEGELAVTLSIGEGLPATDVFTGVWADQQTVWAATQTSTYMSSDGGWSWTFLLDKRAVGRGLFVEGGSLLAGKKATFQEERQFPMILYNTGRLSFKIGGTEWLNCFEFNLIPAATNIAMFTNDSVVVSPNGYFVMTQSPTKDVKLYLNVWNSHRVTEYCRQPGNVTACAAGYLAYCEKTENIDAGCSCINRKAEAARLFDTTNLPEITKASLEDIAPCVSLRCKSSNAGAHPIASLGTSCLRPLVICTNMVINSGTIATGVTQNNNCGSDNSLPCDGNTCPAGLKCFRGKCRLQCDEKCTDASQECYDGMCIPRNEVPRGLSTIVWLIIGAGAIGLGLLIFFLVRKTPKPTPK